MWFNYIKCGILSSFSPGSMSSDRLWIPGLGMINKYLRHVQVWRRNSALGLPAPPSANLLEHLLFRVSAREQYCWGGRGVFIGSSQALTIVAGSGYPRRRITHTRSSSTNERADATQLSMCSAEARVATLRHGPCRKRQLAVGGER
jgi:hypothetical protein